MNKPKLNEDDGGGGEGMADLGSINGMGSIVGPTEDRDGSGDSWGPYMPSWIHWWNKKKKKARKKRKSKSRS